MFKGSKISKISGPMFWNFWNCKILKCGFGNVGIFGNSKKTKLQIGFFKKEMWIFFVKFPSSMGATHFDAKVGSSGGVSIYVYMYGHLNTCMYIDIFTHV